MYFIIVADDLTGAADTAARCFGAGLPALVYPAPPQQALAAGASAFTSDSRHLPVVQAAQTVSALIDSIDAPSDAIWYKKIDSTLRGNLGSELDAMLQALANKEGAAGEPACAVICPAFPDQGRGLLNGQLVMRTGGAQGIHLPTRLLEQSTRPQATIALTDVQQGATHLAQCIEDSVRGGAQFLTVDALTNTDLDTIVAAARHAAPRALFCGSAGLAGALTAHLLRQHSQTLSPGRIRKQLPAQRATLVVAGSGNPVAQRQIQQMRGMPNLHAIECQPQRTWALSPDLILSNPTILLHLPPPDASALLDGPEARTHAAMLGEQAATLWQMLWPRRAILTGGDTAMAVLSRVGIGQLTTVQELMPGIALARGEDRWGRTVEVILKPGGFGDDQTLVQLVG
ncbi:MAG: four-carbon acid sugar kinase family protein [Caldilineaceae bacterium]